MPNRILLGDSPTTVACITIQTGQPGCRALFYPSIYKLLLVIEDKTQNIDLGYAGSRLLEILIERAGDAVEREDLIGFAWPERIVGQGSLNQQIYTLRQILGDEKSRKIIQTLPRRGYLFHPDFIVRANTTVTAELMASANESAVMPSAANEDDQVVAEPLAIAQVIATENSALTAVDVRGERKKETERETESYAAAEAPALAINTVKAPTTSRNWRVLGTALGVVGIALVTSLYLTRGNSESPVHEYRQLEKLKVVYTGHNSAELQQLIANTHRLTERLAGLNNTAGTVFLHKAGDSYEVLCFSHDTSGQELTIHQHQLDQTTDAQLRKCFPD